MEADGGFSGYTSRVCSVSCHSSVHTGQVAFLPDANLGVIVLANLEKANTFSTVISWYVYDTLLGLVPWLTATGNGNGMKPSS